MILLEHAIFLVRWVLGIFIPDEPAWIGKARMQIEVRIIMSCA